LAISGAAAIAVAAILSAPATSAAKPKCFGKRATKTGHGKVVGTSHRDVIVGLGGKNKIIGNGGADVICGGRGNDRILLGNHPNSPSSDGSGILIGGPGSDICRGGAGRDRYVTCEATRKLLGRPAVGLLDALDR
jgi:Ca2+-binding RTX toxin-like protein